jgi:hypothetical protein
MKMEKVGVQQPRIAVLGGGLGGTIAAYKIALWFVAAPS